MPRKKQSAADYIERHDFEMRIILGELVAYSGQINLWWANASRLVRDHPEEALSSLAEAETYLSNHVRIELRDSLRRIHSAMDLLDAELPDDEGAGPHTAPSGDIGEHQARRSS